MDFISGFLASTIAVYTIQPLDTVKTHIQTNLNAKSVFDVSKTIYQNHGLAGFYKGSLSMVSTYPIFWSTFFYVKKNCIIKSDSNIFNSISNTFIASSVASAIANPLFVLKVRKQTEIDKNNYFYKIKNLYKIDGIGGLYKGIVPTLISNTKLCIQFPLYDYIIEKYDNNILIASFLSKFISNSIFYPTDIVRSIQRNRNGKNTINVILKEIYLKHGLKGLFRGFLIYNVVSCPNFIIMMFAKSYIDKTLIKFK